MSNFLRHSLSDQVHLALFQRHHAGALVSHIEADRVRLEEWLPWAAAINDTASASAFIDRYLLKFANADGLLLGMWTGNQVIGGVVLRRIDWSALETEIGYWIDGQYGGRGLVTRAAAAVLDYVFDELGLRRVSLQAAVTNNRSLAVARRLGFIEEGIARRAGKYSAGYFDHATFGLLRTEWKELEGPSNLPA